MHLIDETNYFALRDVTKDILYMYRDITISYAGFGHGIDTGSYDAALYVDCVASADFSLDSYSIDLQLIQEGSAISLLSDLSDVWDEQSHEGEIPNESKLPFVELLSAGRLKHLPLAEKACEAGLRSREEMNNGLKAVYVEYVVGYLERLYSKGKQAVA